MKLSRIVMLQDGVPVAESIDQWIDGSGGVRFVRPRSTTKAQVDRLLDELLAKLDNAAQNMTGARNP